MKMPPDVQRSTFQSSGKTAARCGEYLKWLRPIAPFGDALPKDIGNLDDDNLKRVTNRS
jgi:hypothetical protein